MRERIAVATLLPCGLALGAFSLSIARAHPDLSYGGASAFAGAAELLAGYALLAVGLVAWARPRERRLGAILVAASIAWFLAEWNDQDVGSAVVFTSGLVLYAAAPPLVAHIALTYPEGRIRSRLDRLGLATAYAGGVIVLGLLATSVFDQAAQGCGFCPRNLLLVDGNAAVWASVNHVGFRLGLAWSLLLILLIVAGLVRSTPARRRLSAPVALAGCAYLGFVAADYAHSVDRGVLGTDSLDRRLWLGEAAALCALSLGVVWTWMQRRWTRSSLARLVVEFADAPRPGGLRDALAATIADPSLQLAYPLADERLIDARGQPVELEGEVTPIVHAGREVALLAHQPGLLDDPALVDEVAAAARLALENERLQAEAQAQLEELRASRSRIVEAGDAERRRLERDLHDGAQQRLVGLLLALRLARSRVEGARDPAVLERIDGAETELRAALDDLRRLAHGIFPAALAEEGLAAAVEALAEEARIPLEVTALPAERLDPSVEAAAYFVISEAVRKSSATALEVCAARRGIRVVVEVAGDGEPSGLVELEDRVGALDGSLEVVREPGGQVTIRAEIPCES